MEIAEEDLFDDEDEEEGDPTTTECRGVEPLSVLEPVAMVVAGQDQVEDAGTAEFSRPSVDEVYRVRVQSLSKSQIRRHLSMSGSNKRAGTMPEALYRALVGRSGWDGS